MSATTLDILVDDLPTTLQLYDQIQVWRSPAINGTYAELTAADATAARVLGSIAGPWVLNGLTLTFSLNQADPNAFIFSGTDPIDLLSVLTKINALYPNIASEVAPNTGKLALTSPNKGTGSAVQVTVSAAATALGLSTAPSLGQASRISLTSPTEIYKFVDLGGSGADFYKTRFYSTLTGQVSAFSAPRQGNPQTRLSPSSLSVASVDLADVTGKPIVGRRVIFVPLGTQVVSGSSSVGVLPGFDSVIVVTDYRGHAEIPLLIGMNMRVFFEGSQYHRDFVVPDEDFDVLEIIGMSPDPFDIVQAPPRPIRVI